MLAADVGTVIRGLSINGAPSGALAGLRICVASPDNVGVSRRLSDAATKRRQSSSHTAGYRTEAEGEPTHEKAVRIENPCKFKGKHFHYIING